MNNNNDNNDNAGKYIEPNIFTHFNYEILREEAIYDHMNRVKVIKKFKFPDSLVKESADCEDSEKMAADLAYDQLEKHNSIINIDKKIVDKILKDTRKFINK